MGSATIAGNTLNSVVKVEQTFKKTVVEHIIPGTASIMQSIGRSRHHAKVYGILNPSSEITAVGNIAALSGTGTAAAATAVTDSAGTDWLGGQASTYFVDSVEVETEPGTAKPWGKYVITLREVS